MIRREVIIFGSLIWRRMVLLRLFIESGLKSILFMKGDIRMIIMKKRKMFLSFFMVYYWLFLFYLGLFCIIFDRSCWFWF